MELHGCIINVGDCCHFVPSSKSVAAGMKFPLVGLITGLWHDPHLEVNDGTNHQKRVEEVEEENGKKKRVKTASSKAKKSETTGSDPDTDDDSAVVVPSNARRDIVLKHKKSLEATQKAEKKMLAASADTSSGFLQQKKNVQSVVSERLKALSGGKGAAKSLKAVTAKIEEKGIEVDDLTTSSDGLLARVKAMCKDLKAKKTKIPSLKKAGLPGISEELKSTSNEYAVTGMPNMFLVHYQYQYQYHTSPNPNPNPILIIYYLKEG